MTLSTEKNEGNVSGDAPSRRLDERAWVLHRQGQKLHSTFPGSVRKRRTIGAVYALTQGKDWLVPYYRDLAMLLAWA